MMCDDGDAVIGIGWQRASCALRLHAPDMIDILRCSLIRFIDCPELSWRLITGNASPVPQLAVSSAAIQLYQMAEHVPMTIWVCLVQ